MAFKRSQSIYVAARPEALYDYLTDLSRHPEWADQPMEIAVDGTPIVPGTTFSSTVRFLGKIEGRGRVVEMRRPDFFVYECRDSSGLHRWTMTIEPEGTGSQLTHTLERVWVPLYVKLMQARIMWPLLGRPQVRKGLVNIKSRVESLSRAEDSPRAPSEQEAK